MNNNMLIKDHRNVSIVDIIVWINVCLYNTGVSFTLECGPILHFLCYYAVYMHISDLSLCLDSDSQSTHTLW